MASPLTDILEIAEYLNCVCLYPRGQKHSFSILSLYVISQETKLASVEELKVLT